MSAPPERRTTLTTWSKIAIINLLPPIVGMSDETVTTLQIITDATTINAGLSRETLGELVDALTRAMQALSSDQQETQS